MVSYRLKGEQPPTEALNKLKAVSLCINGGPLVVIKGPPCFIEFWLLMPTGMRGGVNIRKGSIKKMSAREEKQVIVNELKEKLKAGKVAILTDYRGLDVSAMTRLRRKLRESNSELKVAKNTLARLAAREAGLDDLEPYLQGPTAIAFSMGDPVVPAKVMVDLTREFKQLEIKAGILEGKIIHGEEVRQLAELPSREVLLGKVVGGMQAPLYGLVNVFNASLKNLVYVLDAVHRQKAGNVAG